MTRSENPDVTGESFLLALRNDYWGTAMNSKRSSHRSCTLDVRKLAGDSSGAVNKKCDCVVWPTL